MLKIKHKGRILESSEQGITTQITMTGTFEECKAALDAADYGTKHTDYGYLKSVQMQQEEGPLWMIQYKYSTASATGSTPPESDTGYGKKSAVLSTGLLSLPLKKIPHYLTKWDHYLFGHSGAEIPVWYETATDTTDTGTAYKWGKNLSDRPDGMVELASPTKPGVTGVDYATYQITETAKFRTAKEAGAFVANKLNRISTPSEDFGIIGGNWKCDSATVSWRNKAWYATLTYTRSGDEQGWDIELYY